MHQNAAAQQTLGGNTTVALAYNISVEGLNVYQALNVLQKEQSPA